ncbi:MULTISPECIES: CBS domain-containing protein [Streptomyces]|uniref:CBS domain-containing protein n=1 Tax=Streptomyces lycii TaxID=2654337 RepID=A0ABQ7FI52_9ACTN|nr:MULTISPECIES: CBS domain-containing protein [Streptomyces]KAF4407623.1 CBS domain-containing protein [Streptomyces lycii]PGH47136.1 oxidoreductase [Streptomyces sp. Ru87]
MVQQVREVMTGRPVTVRPDTPVAEVARRMRDEDIGAVVVAEEDQVKALVTDRDLAVRILTESGDTGAKTVRDACSPELVTVSPQDSVDKAVELMRGHAVRRLPVVEDGRAVGIVSLGDLAVERDPESALSHVSAADPNR